MRAKKSLGQNFLKSEAVAEIIINASDIKADDTVLEIGPGKGFLTKKILEKAGKVVVVEKDDRLIFHLKDLFSEHVKSGKLEIIRGDILDIDPKEIIKKPFKITANIPYYITGQVIRKFLSGDFQPSKMVLMLQKEVAERIVDQPESILSVSVKVYGTPKYIKTVKAKYFSPVPKVDSAVLLIDNISKDFFTDGLTEDNFFEVVKIGFSQKRKTLINNLKNLKNFEWMKREDWENILQKIKISPLTRAEILSIKDWKNLVSQILKKAK